MKNSTYYIIASVYFAVFAAELILGLSIGFADELSAAAVMAMLGGVCLALIPTSLTPSPKMTFVKNDFKRRFSKANMLPVYRFLLFAGAVFFTFGAVLAIISYVGGLF